MDWMVWEVLAFLSTVNKLVMLIICSLSYHGLEVGLVVKGIKGRRMDEPVQGQVDGWLE